MEPRDRAEIDADLEALTAEETEVDAAARELAEDIKRRRQSIADRKQALREEIANSELAPIRRYLASRRRREAEAGVSRSSRESGR